MGFKSTNKQTSQSNNCNTFKVGGLLFDSKEDYLLFKNIDKNINDTVKSVKDGSIDLKDVFNNVKTISVKECYYEAREELDGLFENATGLLCYEGTTLVTEYKVGCCFFDKINVIEYCDYSDSDDDDDDRDRISDNYSGSGSNRDRVSDSYYF